MFNCPPPINDSILEIELLKPPAIVEFVPDTRFNVPPPIVPCTAVETLYKPPPINDPRPPATF